VFHDPGLRFVFSPRSALPDILNEDGQPRYAGSYCFEPGRDDVVRSGRDGWIVSYGDVLSEALDAVTALKESGIDVGLVNKSCLNVVDEAALAQVGKGGFVLVAESQNVQTGLGLRYGTWLTERGFHPRFGRAGTHVRGDGGALEQVVQQGLDSASLVRQIKKLAG